MLKSQLVEQRAEGIPTLGFPPLVNDRSANQVGKKTRPRQKARMAQRDFTSRKKKNWWSSRLQLCLPIILSFFEAEIIL